MSHNVTPNTSRVELRKTLTLVPVVMMGLAYMQPMTLFDTFGIVSSLCVRIDCDPVYGSELREAGSPLSFCWLCIHLRPEIH